MPPSSRARSQGPAACPAATSLPQIRAGRLDVPHRGSDTPVIAGPIISAGAPRWFDKMRRRRDRRRRLGLDMAYTARDRLSGNAKTVPPGRLTWGGSDAARCMVRMSDWNHESEHTSSHNKLKSTLTWHRRITWNSATNSPLKKSCKN